MDINFENVHQMNAKIMGTRENCLKYVGLMLKCYKIMKLRKYTTKHIFRYRVRMTSVPESENTRQQDGRT